MEQSAGHELSLVNLSSGNAGLLSSIELRCDKIPRRAIPNSISSVNLYDYSFVSSPLEHQHGVQV